MKTATYNKPLSESTILQLEAQREHLINTKEDNYLLNHINKVLTTPTVGALSEEWAVRDYLNDMVISLKEEVQNLNHSPETREDFIRDSKNMKKDLEYGNRG